MTSTPTDQTSGQDPATRGAAKRIGPGGARRLLLCVLLVYGLTALVTLPLDVVSHQDEAYYLSSTRTMLETGNTLIPSYEGEPRIRKPIGFYWLTLPMQWVAGPSLWSARLASTAAGVGLLLIAWRITGFYFRSPMRRVGCVVMLASADIVHRYAHYAVPEVSLTLAMTTAHLAFLYWDRARRADEPGRAALWVFYTLMGVAFMIKGPVGILLPMGTGVVYLLLNGRWRDTLRLISPVGLALMALVIAPWYGLVIREVGFESFRRMVANETAGRMGFRLDNLLFYVPVLLLYYLPWPLFLAAPVFRMLRPKRFIRYRRAALPRSYPLVWLGAYFLFYSVLVSEKHQWYGLQWAVPLTVLLASLVLNPAGGLRDRIMYRRFGAVAIGIALAVALGSLSLGGILGAPWGIAVMLTLLLLVAVVVFWTARIGAVRPPLRLLTLALAAVLVRSALFHVGYTTTQLRPASDFAHAMNTETEPYDLMLEQRRFRKSLTRHDLPGLARVHDFEGRHDDFMMAWPRELPRYVICWEEDLAALSPEVRAQYTVAAEGYSRRSKRDRGGASTSEILLVERNPQMLFRRVLLMRRM